jgi:hypothetical protein
MDTWLVEDIPLEYKEEGTLDRGRHSYTLRDRHWDLL